MITTRSAAASSEPQAAVAAAGLFSQDEALIRALLDEALTIAPVTEEAAERTEAADQKIDLRPLLAQLIRHEVEIDTAGSIRKVVT